MDRKIGEVAVRAAREAIEAWVRERKRVRPKLPEFFNQKLGVFVTIKTYPEKKLRGCIGFVESDFPLSEGLVEAAIFATRDPRFPELRKEELDSIVIEVSILTKPEPINTENPEELPERISIGRDGLIARKSLCSGLLLPQVAVEHKMDAETFLSHTCLKAGLSPDEWKDGSVKIYRFSAKVFAEETPRGKIIEETRKEASETN